MGYTHPNRLHGIGKPARAEIALLLCVGRCYLESLSGHSKSTI